MLLVQKILHYSVGRSYSAIAPTIYALSSGHGKCGVAVIRISGPQSSDAIMKMTKGQTIPKARMAVLRHVMDPETQEEIDRGLVLWFPGPKSFTGEDSCEFQVHGGPAVVSSVLTALSKLENFRPAEPGEFTKRAFHSGKLDLVEVEGLGDLIHAETEMQRKQALLQMEGNLSKIYGSWRSILLKNLAHIEAYIDFSEDEHIEENLLETVNKNLSLLADEMDQHIIDGRCGERLRDGVKTVIIGEPNVGKSSLLNALSQRPAAIVTPIPGTTRDVIESHININGYPIVLTDTAGLRNQTLDIIEKEGIIRAQACAEEADLIILVIDATKCVSLLENSINIRDFIKSHVKVLNLEHIFTHLLTDDHKKYSVVFNKLDLLSDKYKIKIRDIAEKNNVTFLSCTTEEGLPGFINAITQQLKILCGNPSRENPSLTKARHKFHIIECRNSIREYFTINTDENIPLAAHHLQKALRHLGKITGVVNSEEILDVIFQDFCIGK